MQTARAIYKSEIGPIEVVGNQQGILMITFVEKGFRAVGNANNKNRIPLIIPCHRVIGSDGMEAD